MRIRTFVLTAALTTTGLVTLPAEAALAAPSGLSGDFNGDGYRDLVVAAPDATVSGKDSAGTVVVFYGSANGVSATRRQTVSQSSAGIPGAAENSDRFGETLATGDLDLDGYADLLIGAPREDVDGDRDAGSLTIVWGGASGLGAGATVEPSSVPDTECAFAESLTVGDTDANGAADIAVGSRCSVQYFQGPFTHQGAPLTQGRDHQLGNARDAVTGNVDSDKTAERVMLPGLSGDDAGGRVYVDDWAQGQYRRTELTDADGTTGAIGDVNGDGYGDLILGDDMDPETDRPDAHLGGEISVWYGGPTGIDPGQTPTRINQDTAGVPGTGEGSDRFGFSVSSGDTNSDGFSDVVVGAPGEDVDGKDSAGSVTVLLGSARGLTGSGARAIHENTEGVAGAVEASDTFGAVVDLADRNRDGKADLSVGVPGENGSGCTWNTHGTSVTGSLYLCADKLGVTGDYAAFGSVISR
ncbi:FG-GAP-like repeat-containing protein [Streptomyces sp. NPDC048436]|uniref:FG-GAP-like repeat-containing protein n=1 Tax=Streptomyces sp. NPDC048436 TaxID=3365550 RepID=UPI003712FEDB